MGLRWLRAVGLLALFPAAALAFETVDSLPFPSGGGFPAWSADPVMPWTLFAYGGLLHDSNAFRRATREQSDIVARVGAGGRATGRLIGRQRFLVEGFGEYYDFDRFSQIDHFGYGALGHFLWEVGNDVSGLLGYERRHRHADLGEFRREVRSMVTSERYTADAGYRFHPDWRIAGLVEHTSADRGGPDRADVDTDRARATLTYSTPRRNSIGLEVGARRGDVSFFDSATGLRFADEFDQREIAAAVGYALGAQLRVRGRVGHTEREYEELRDNDFAGTTYAGAVDWLPTGKLRFTFEAVRGPEAIIDASATHVLRRGMSFAMAYAATYKLVFTARFINERRQYEGDADAVLLGILRDDTARTWAFGAGWEPMRHWQLGAGVDFGERRSNILGRDYDYRQYMINARWTF